MAIFNDEIPAESEAAKQGASRIREMKTSLNSMLSQIFDDTLVFLPGWVTGTLIKNSASVDADRSINSDHIKNNAILLRMLASSLFTADSTGRGKFASGFVNSDLLASDIAFPTGSVDANSIEAGAVGTTALAALAATVPKVGSGVAKIAIGTYSGSDSASATVSGLAFAPDFVIVVGGKTVNKVGIAFLNESVASVGPIHSLWDNDNVDNTNDDAIQWTANGFVIVPSNYNFNDLGKTHSYIALKV